MKLVTCLCSHNKMKSLLILYYQTVHSINSETWQWNSVHLFYYLKWKRTCLKTVCTCNTVDVPPRLAEGAVLEEWWRLCAHSAGIHQSLSAWSPPVCHRPPAEQSIQTWTEMLLCCVQRVTFCRRKTSTYNRTESSATFISVWILVILLSTEAYFWKYCLNCQPNGSFTERVSRRAERGWQQMT